MQAVSQICDAQTIKLQRMKDYWYWSCQMQVISRAQYHQWLLVVQCKRCFKDLYAPETAILFWYVNILII